MIDKNAGMTGSYETDFIVFILQAFFQGIQGQILLGEVQIATAPWVPYSEAFSNLLDSPTVLRVPRIKWFVLVLLVRILTWLSYWSRLSSSLNNNAVPTGGIMASIPLMEASL